MLSLAMLSQSCSFCKLPPTVASPRNSLSLQNTNTRYAVRTCVRRRRPCHRIQSFLGQGNPLGKGIADVQNAIKRAFESASEGMKSITRRLPWKPKLKTDGGDGGSTWGSGGIGGGRGGNTYTLNDEDEEPDWHAFFTIIAFVSLYTLMLYREDLQRYIRKHKRRFRRWRRRKLKALEYKIVSYNTKSDIISGYAIDDEADNEVFEYGMED